MRWVWIGLVRITIITALRIIAGLGRLMRGCSAGRCLIEGSGWAYSTRPLITWLFG